MHVTLISADHESWASGMRGVSATLRDAGHETTMIFAGDPEATIDDAVLGKIAALARDSAIIGVSSMCRGSGRAKLLLGGLRGLGAVTVWGGIHPTLYPGDCVPHADLVCRGEGEGFILDLVERVDSRAGFGDIPNAAFLAGDGSMVLNDLRPLVADLDTLPLPDFAFEREYVLDPDGSLRDNAAMRETNTFLFSGSRGCDNHCAYCSNSQLMSICRGKGRYARKVSIARFLDLAEQCRARFPLAKDAYFTDEDFFARPADELREFAEEYPSRVGLPFECMASPRQVTDEKVGYVAKAGAWRVDVGLESGSERVRREIFNRHVSDEAQIAAAVAISRQRSISPYYFLILGNPYEDRQDLLDGLDLLRKLPLPFSLSIYNLVLIPGTKLFYRACADGIIGGMDDSAFEMDFLAGYDCGDCDWKRKNLYLNALIALMRGRVTRWRMGEVPRVLMPLLTSPRVIDFCEDHPRIGEAMAVRSQVLIYGRVRLPEPVRRALRPLRRALVELTARSGGTAMKSAAAWSGGSGSARARTGAPR